MQIEICPCCGKPKKPKELVTKEARFWDGWNVALKPAWEPILVAMKPVDSTFASNALAYGVAGLWIDGARVGLEGYGAGGGFKVGSGDNSNQSPTSFPGSGIVQPPNSKGRFPANLIFSHADGCRRRGTRRVRGSLPASGPTLTGESTSNSRGKFNGIEATACHTDPDGYERVDDWECQPDCPVAILAAQSGERRASMGGGTHRTEVGNAIRMTNPPIGHRDPQYYDHGTAARFFYQAKSSRSERNLGCQDVYWRKDRSAPVGFVRVSRDEWEALPEKQRARGNIHCTVKPLGVVEYLCRLTRTPTGGVVFDPFAGTGTTALGAFKTGRHWLCCDNQPDYVYLANLRIKALKAETPQMELSL